MIVFNQGFPLVRQTVNPALNSSDWLSQCCYVKLVGMLQRRRNVKKHHTAMVFKLFFFNIRLLMNYVYNMFVIYLSYIKLLKGYVSDNIFYLFIHLYVVQNLFIL